MRFVLQEKLVIIQRKAPSLDSLCHKNLSASANHMAGLDCEHQKTPRAINQ